MYGSFCACVLSYIPMMPAHWRLSFCPDRRLTACSSCSAVCLTTVGIKADKSLSAWAVRRGYCLVLVQLSFNRKLGPFAFFVVCPLAHFRWLFWYLLSFAEEYARICLLFASMVRARLPFPCFLFVRWDTSKVAPFCLEACFEAACWRSIPCRCRAIALPWVNSSLEASSLFYACLVQFVRASSLVCSWCLFIGVCRFVLIGLTARSYCSLVCLTTVGIKADKSLSIRFALCDHFAVTSNK